MDSLTHLTAGVITPLAFRRAPRSAWLIVFGIVCAQLPDIDIIAGSSARAMLVIHRGITHSLLVLLAVSVFLALFFRRVKPSEFCLSPSRPESFDRPCQGWSFTSLWLCALLGLSLHVYLDCMTTFGTRILLPFSNYRVSMPAMFIVEPLFTLPLLISAFFLLKWLNRPELLARQIKLARLSLVFIIVYPLVTLGLAKGLENGLNKNYAGPGTEFERVRVTPEPGSPFIWRAVAENSGYYRIGAFYAWDPAPVFGRAYAKPDPALWAALQRAEPILEEHARFVTFAVQSEKALPDGGREITYADLRYVSALENLFRMLGRDDGMFIMQVRLDAQNRFTAWRYLSRGNDALTQPWVGYPEPLAIF